ncbi:unnamed protein product [Meganyctiphanes norvegica]|uniref:Ig-like domain-containing protein n=1 Tax=Meganyctiphanes norvegica TaxID=48144 RepID=A0AAV2PKP5_MEGNR
MVRVVVVLVLLCSLAPLQTSAWLWGSDDDDAAKEDQEEELVILEDPVVLAEERESEPERPPVLETRVEPAIVSGSRDVDDSSRFEYLRPRPPPAAGQQPGREDGDNFQVEYLRPQLPPRPSPREDDNIFRPPLPPPLPPRPQPRTDEDYQRPPIRPQQPYRPRSVPPKIDPFYFPNNVMSEGSRAYLTCYIREGDLPVNLRWEKDGGPVPQYEGITTRYIDDYTSRLQIDRITSRLSGEYTCLATNQAGTTWHTASLRVNRVSPPRPQPQPSGEVVRYIWAGNFSDPNAPGEVAIPGETRDPVDFVLGEGGVKCDTSCRGACITRDRQCRCMQNVTCFEMLKHRFNEPAPQSYVIPPGCPKLMECKHSCAYVVQWPDGWCLCHKDPICLQWQRRNKREARQAKRANRKAERRAARITKREAERKAKKEARRENRRKRNSKHAKGNSKHAKKTHRQS